MGISLPPLVPPYLTTIPKPTPINNPEKTLAINKSVIGRGSKKVSNKMSMDGYSNDPYNDLIKAFLPRSKKASASSNTLAKKTIRPIGMVKNRFKNKP
jgi:hypothetical protein